MTDRVAVLVFLDPEKLDELKMPEDSWHLLAKTKVEGIETGEIARAFAAELPKIASARKAVGRIL